MSSEEMNNISNWFRLQHLLGNSCVCLRRLFKKRYQQFFKQEWNGSPTLGNQLYQQFIKKKFSKFRFFQLQITLICNGDSNEWDLTILTALFLSMCRPQNLNSNETQALDKQDKLLEDLRDIRNELAHHATKQITDTDFNKSWQQVKTILIDFGENDTEIDQIKDIEFKSLKEIIDDNDVKEMNHINALGNQSFKDKNYIDAIKYFTKAIVLPHIPSKDRALLYSNLSSTRLALYNQQQETDSIPTMLTTVEDERYRALKDAKQARNLRPQWWKAHYRVGKAYSTMNEHEKAINSFERGLALEPFNCELKKTKDTSRTLYSQQQRYEHLDPRLKPQTMTEHLNETKNKFGIDPQGVRLGHLWAEMGNDLALASVNKGHQYFHGDPEMGIEQDHEQAAKYYAEAMRQGNAEGIYNLGLMYDDNEHGVKINQSFATKLFMEAASHPARLPGSNRLNNGVAEAQHALGLRYNHGIDVTKNLATATYWYKLAAENGCEHAANNLATMYLDGSGVEQNQTKAKQWFQFAAKKGDPNAMRAMARLSLEAKDFKMARLWHQWARDAGNGMAKVSSDEFSSIVDQEELRFSQFSPFFMNLLNEMREIADMGNIKPMPSQISSSVYNYAELKDYALKGSMTAKKICYAIEHYLIAVQMIINSAVFDENQFIHALAEACRTEHQVIRITDSELYKKFKAIINNSLKNKPDDVDSQMCYLMIQGDELEQNAKFLYEWKMRNPSCVHLYEFSADINCFLKRYDLAILDCNTGLQLDSTNNELLYTKAVALRLMPEIARSDVITAYQAFLSLAPKDHRKVPEAHYALAQCYLPQKEPTEQDTTSETSPDEVYRIYEQGLEFEKLQLPCYLPYISTSKILLERHFNFIKMCKADGIQANHNQHSSNRQNSDHLLDPCRVELFREHRRFLSRLQAVKDNSLRILVTSTNRPSPKQKQPKNLTNLKSITLKEMNPTKNHIYEDYVLSVTIIKQTLTFEPPISILVEDDNLDIEQLFIYGFDKRDGQHLIENVFTIGNKMAILNPSMKLEAMDLKPGICIDDFQSIIMRDESEKVIKMCRCCGKANATNGCGRCNNARYCSRECQNIDWEHYGHKLICKTVTK